MARMFDIDPWVMNPEDLNNKVESKVMSVIRNNKPVEHVQRVDTPSKVISYWSEEELRAIRGQMDKVYASLRDMNATWDISTHMVKSNNTLVAFLKRTMWKAMKVVLKPIVSSVTDFNVAATITISELIKTNELMIAAEERRVSK